MLVKLYDIIEVERREILGAIISDGIISTMRDQILQRLQQLEVDENVVILYACESGSRAWGFPSADSDYDCRFIYTHTAEWYLTIQDKRDVIETPLVDNFDIKGWDIRKALGLFRRSNPPLLEWLGSPIVYWEKGGFANQLRELSKEYYAPAACMYHYLHMAQGNANDYLRGEQVRLKKYFYVLRPILAMNWIERGYGVAPTAFANLVERVVDDPNLKSAIDRLIELKQTGSEADHGAHISAFDDFIEAELKRLASQKQAYQNNPAPIELLDDLFRNTLRAAWNL